MDTSELGLSRFACNRCQQGSRELTPLPAGYNQGMVDNVQQDDRSSRAWPVAWRFLAPLILVPILYVLSAGPSVWLYHSGWLSAPWDEVLSGAYYPVTLAEEKLPPLAAYLEWWKPARPKSKPPAPIPTHKFAPLPPRTSQTASPD